MGLFKKAQHTAPLPDTGHTPATQAAGIQPIGQLTVEEIARRWWTEKFGTPLPEEVKDWLKQLARAEARRLNLTGLKLTAQQEQRAQEAKKLALVKRDNVEQTMAKVRTQMDWLQNYQRLKQELKRHSDRLYEVNKRLAASERSEKELERYETFETVQGTYERMRLLERLGRENKEGQSLIARQLEAAQQQLQDAQKEAAHQADRLNESEKRMVQASELIEQGYRILGERRILNIDLDIMQEAIDTMLQQKQALDIETRELQSEIQRLQALAARQGADRQALEPHRRMLMQGTQALLWLDILGEAGKEMEEVRQQHAESQRRQREIQRRLEQVFAQYQRIENEMQTLRAEILRHRHHIAGSTSHALQERAMKLNIRHRMLVAAQSLAARIRQNYKDTEEHAQRETQLRLHISNLQQDIDALSKEVSTLQRMCKDKEYTLTLGKSQNVIQLRSDLKEGVSCTVCGATNHPYHSDTILEQNILISRMRTEYESMQAELTAKEKRLMQLRIDLASAQAHQEAKVEHLSLLRALQGRNVKEWSTYIPLDQSFADCSPSTNHELRASMIRQLIENTIHDAEEAQRELDTYNYHQSRINETSDALAQKEREKNDLTLRLNELNTGCQVLTRQEEHLQKAYADVRARYIRRYEDTNKTITLTDWFKLWQNSPESLKLRITEMIQQWTQLNADIGKTQQALVENTATLAGNRQREALLEANIQWTRQNREQRMKLRKEGEQQYHRALEGQTVKDYEAAHRLNRDEAAHACAQYQEASHKATVALALLQGKRAGLQAQGQHIDAETVAERSELDLWIRRYNTNHPPVQYSELERAFSGETDWNAIRHEVRETHIESIVEQALVNALRSDILHMQSTATQPAAGNNEPSRDSLVAQLAQLEQQYHEVSLQIAEQEMALRRNALYKTRLAAEEQALQDLADK